MKNELSIFEQSTTETFGFFQKVLIALVISL